MDREKVTETDVELCCAQLAQKCLFVMHVVYLLSIPTDSEATEQDQIGLMTWGS
jgi:hypothetical protein